MEFHLDLQWWFQFLSSWYGIAFWLFPGMAAAPAFVGTSDASGSLGFGAYFRGEWFSGSWTTSQASQSIAYKELFPVVIAAHLWGPQWARCYVLFRSDNEAVVHILNSRTSKIPDMMHLLHHLLAPAAVLIFSFPPSMFPGFIIVLLIPCPAFIGGSSGDQESGARSSVASSVYPTSAVGGIDQPSLEQQCQFFSGPGLRCFYSQILLVWSETFHHLLCPDGQIASQWLSMPNQ